MELITEISFTIYKGVWELSDSKRSREFVVMGTALKHHTHTQELFVHHFLSDTTSSSDASCGPHKVNVLP